MFSFTTTLLITTVAVDLGLIPFVYSRRHGGPTQWSFALFVPFIACWAVTILGFLHAPADDIAIIFLKLSYVAATLIAACFYYFSLVFPDGSRPSPWHVRLLTGGAGLLCLALLLPGFLTGAMIAQTAERVVVLHFPEYFLFATIFCGLFLGGQIRIWWKYAHAEGQLRKQLFSIGSSVTVIGLLGIYYNLVLPSPFLEDFRYVWTGPVLTAIFAVVTDYSIFRHGLFNTKAFIAEFLVFTLWLLIFVRALIAQTLHEQLGDGLLLAFAVPIGLLLLRSVNIEVKARETLAAANDRLQELDRMKSEFLSLATHQLRGPVGIIRSFVAEIEDGSYGRIPAETKQALGRVGESARGLASIIDDYLNVSRIEQGQMKYELAVADLDTIVSKTAAELSVVARLKGLSLSYTKDTGGSFTAKLDAEKIRQVVFNLIDNAIKYTPKGLVTVNLTHEAASRTLVLSISDTGVGIDPQTLPDLFKKFSRAAGAGRVNAGGTGLGLYVARQLVEAHGGTISVESPGLGKGSTFFVRIPAV
jgi:signal transduction histidine kinase